MADIQHSLITDPYVHEPKGVTSAGADEVYVADGAGSGTWTKAENLPTATGWENHEDSTYTSASPITLSASTRTKLTIDGLSARTNTTYSPVPGVLWDNTNNLITPENIGDFYDIRLRFDAEPAVSDGFITLELDIGGSEGVILAQTQRFLKGTSAQKMLFTATTFTLDTFVANGGAIYATSSVDVDVYDVGLLINRTFKAV